MNNQTDWYDKLINITASTSTEELKELHEEAKKEASKAALKKLGRRVVKCGMAVGAVVIIVTAVKKTDEKTED